MRDLAGKGQGAKILDLGCGNGGLVQGLVKLGFEGYGCDVDNELWNAGDMATHWRTEALTDPARLHVIQQIPYRLPFDDGTFDAVVSTSVLEHTKNKAEVFLEIRRVLKPGGLALHLLPSKWYLPLEPHIFVPLVNFMWPHCPDWWFRLWAFLGIRNEFQKGQHWQEVARNNQAYSKSGLDYWSPGALRRLSMEVFGNYEAPLQYLMQHSTGGAAALHRRLPFPAFTAKVLGYVRIYCILSRKESRPA